VFGGKELGEGSNVAKVAGLSVELEAGWIRTTAATRAKEVRNPVKW
jgi:hypothetical protein